MIKVLIFFLLVIGLLSQEYKLVVPEKYKFSKSSTYNVYVIDTNVVVFLFYKNRIVSLLYSCDGRYLASLEYDVKAKDIFKSLPLNVFYLYSRKGSVYWFCYDKLFLLDFDSRSFKVVDVPTCSYFFNGLNPIVGDSIFILLNEYDIRSVDSYSLEGKAVFSAFNYNTNKLVRKFGSYPVALNKIEYKYVGSIKCYVDTVDSCVYIQYSFLPKLYSYSLKDFRDLGVRLLIPKYGYKFVGSNKKYFYFVRSLGKLDNFNNYEILAVHKKNNEIANAWTLKVPSNEFMNIRYYVYKDKVAAVYWRIKQMSKDYIKLVYYRKEFY